MVINDSFRRDIESKVLPWKRHKIPASKGLRIAIYSHDTMGLGHKRRNLLIAQTLVRALPNCSVLLITGMVEANAEELPEGIDYLALPAWHKTSHGKYQSRRLDISCSELALLRGKIIRAALETFQPDIFLVDNVPRGVLGELDEVLAFLHKQPETRCILGLRDILDEPTAVFRQWRKAGNEAILRHYFDAIWVYGDSKVYDLVVAYRFPVDIAAKVQYVGYLDGQQWLDYSPKLISPVDTDQPLALCLVGGGQDGAKLAQAFAESAFPNGWQGLLITGPMMPKVIREELHKQAAQRFDLKVLDYYPEPVHLLKQARAVISMGGYNTTCEILSFNVSALVVPRIKPRREQWIRAQRLQKLGLLSLLPPEQVSPEVLTQWLTTLPSDTKAQSKASDCIDIQGLNRIPELVKKIIATNDRQNFPEQTWLPIKAS